MILLYALLVGVSFIVGFFLGFKQGTIVTAKELKGLIYVDKKNRKK